MLPEAPHRRPSAVPAAVQALALDATGGWANRRLPVLIYRGALDRTAGADAFEALFALNHWVTQWHGVIYRYHHFHAAAHEALGIARGSGRLLLGGPSGEEVPVEAGDALLVPAGTGHCMTASAPGFLVVGAYPPGQEWDMHRRPADDSLAYRIAALPDPERDPVQGPGGATDRYWATA